MNEPNPQPNPPAPIKRQKHGSFLQRLQKHKLWLGLGLLVLLFMWRAKSTPPEVTAKNQSLANKGMHTGDKRTTGQDLSDQKLPDAKTTVTDDRTQRTGGYSQPAQKSRSQQAQEALLYRSLYEVNVVTTPMLQPKTEQVDSRAEAPQAPTSQSPAPPAQMADAPKRNPLDFDPHQPLALLPEGTVIEMALDNKLEGEMTGPVACHITTPVYAPGTQTVVIPAGSRVLGEANKVGSFGQQRLLVTFHRILVTDRLGAPLYSIPLDPKESGMDQQGGMGVTGKVNNHITSTVLASLAVGIVSGLGSGIGYSSGGGAIVLGGIGQGTSQAAMEILNRYSNRVPTITVLPGTRVKLLFTSDIELPYYPHQEDL